MQDLRRESDPYYEYSQPRRAHPLVGLPTLSTGTITEEHSMSSEFGSMRDNRLALPPPRQSGTVSPAESHRVPRDFYYDSPSASLGSQFDAPMTSLTHNPKRAYRQRRKDPSCDACRERKVKVRNHGKHPTELISYSAMRQIPQVVLSAQVAMYDVNSPRIPTVVCPLSSKQRQAAVRACLIVQKTGSRSRETTSRSKESTRTFPSI